MKADSSRQTERRDFDRVQEALRRNPALYPEVEEATLARLADPRHSRNPHARHSEAFEESHK